MQDSDEEIVLEEDAEGGPDALLRLREKLATAVKEKQEYLDGWQRSRAELSNALRQFEEDRRSAKKLGISIAVQSLLPALDSLQHAKKAGEIPADFVGIEKQLAAGFAALGVSEISPAAGEAFDPRLHEALMEDAVTEPGADGKITRVLEAGWKIDDHVVRPAKVAVGAMQ